MEGRGHPHAGGKAGVQQTSLQPPWVGVQEQDHPTASRSVNSYHLGCFSLLCPSAHSKRECPTGYIPSCTHPEVVSTKGWGKEFPKGNWEHHHQNRDSEKPKLNEHLPPLCTRLSGIFCWFVFLNQGITAYLEVHTLKCTTLLHVITLT